MSTENVTQSETAPASTAIERAAPIGELPSVQLDPTKGRVGFYSSITPRTASERGLVYRAMVGQAKPLEDSLGETIKVQHVIAHPVEVKDPITGEIKPAVRTILVDTDGKLHGCVSEGVRNSIAKLAGVFGPPPWDDGLEVIPRAVKAKIGRAFFLDVPVVDEGKAPPPPAAPTPAVKPTAPKSK